MIRDPDVFQPFLHSLRRFVRERLVPREAEVAALDLVPEDLVDAMAAQGMFGYSIPEEYGGPGLNYVSYGLIAREVERVDSGY
ncbi:MAG: acyl-CoA dehydrogenase family protein, partial [Cupriavidus sp.]|nr:acyl-CoA dehydrogenase family protein [Cupriavidus sp.]